MNVKEAKKLGCTSLTAQRQFADSHPDRDLRLHAVDLHGKDNRVEDFFEKQEAFRLSGSKNRGRRHFVLYNWNAPDRLHRKKERDCRSGSGEHRSVF